MSPPLPEVVIL